MSDFEKRVQVNKIIESQLPEFIVSDFPKATEFFKQYYISQEFQGGNADIAENLDQYLKLDNLVPEVITGSTYLTNNINSSVGVVTVTSTKGFPSEYGLLKIDDEIITYTGITTNTFTGCVRGFSGITGYNVGISSFVDTINKQTLVFSETVAATHIQGSKVTNLSVLFLQEFYKKLKYTFTPGFEDVDFVADLDVGNFIKNARGFYQSKGVEESVKVLFKVLYGEDALVLDLEKYLIKPSSAKFNRKKVVVSELISGKDPSNLVGQTIFKSTDLFTNAPVSEVEIFTRNSKTYYKLSLFVGYDDRDLVQGTFTIPGKTKVLETVSIGSSIISVDSTIGFGQTGTLISGSNTISYTSKSINQFFGCSGVNSQITLADDIRSDEVVFGYENGDLSKKVELRITGVLSEFINQSDVALSEEGEFITVKNVGESINNPQENASYKEIFANSWIYNTSSRYQISSISGSTFSFLDTIDKSSLRVGDTVDILLRDTNTVVLSNAVVATVNSAQNQVNLNNLSTFAPNPTLEYDLRRKLKKSTSLGVNLLEGNGSYISDVLNVYVDGDEYGYVASNSLPSYTITSNIIEHSIPNGLAPNITGYNTTTNLYSIISFSDTISFIDGDFVVYTASNKNKPLPGLISGETYFIRLISSNQISLYSSKSSLLGSNPVEFDRQTDSGTHTFTLKKHASRLLSPNKILRKFPLSQNIFTKKIKARESGPIGIMVNGVQILSPESDDRIYYGPLESFEVLNGGKDYDIINPPKIQISTGAGITALVDPIITGSVKRVFVDPQDFDVDNIVSVSLIGGNGTGCVLEPVIGERFRELEFDTRDIFFGGGLDITEETITFNSPHNLRDGETIIYNQNGNTPLGIGTFKDSSNSLVSSLVSGGSYVSKFINTSTVRLFNNYSDYLAGINTIGFSTSGNTGGIHKFRTLSKKNLRDITVINGGSGYSYRKLTVKPSGISTHFDTINFINHGFEDGEIVGYSTTGTAISGLSTSNQYYILKVDNNTFRLANAGIGGTSQTNYIKRKYESLQTTGTGYHIFKYPDIQVNINVSYGSTFTGNFILTPVVTGEMVGGYLYESGTGYGSNVLNLQKKPTVTVKNGKEAQLNPIVVGGKIVQVQILNSGYDYYSSPTLEVEGDGSGAIIRPIIENNKITGTIVINPGIGYTNTNTNVRVRPSGSGAIFNARVRSLTLNDVSRFNESLLLDKNNTLSYGILGYNEDISNSIYSNDRVGHSAIVGWAYDGNPIYGPYGYENPSDNQSRVKLLTPGYSLKPSLVVDRPTAFSSGFFIEDYQYDASGDLDINNGRFCKTPEFPNGVYAYFVGVTTSSITGRLEPKYPYFIGDYYRSEFIDDNLKLDHSFDFNNSNLSRNTLPYKSGDSYGGNDFIIESNEIINQRTIIESISKGSISSINILDGGSGYKVGDSVVFDSTDTNGTGLKAEVSELKGKDISKIETFLQRYDNVVFTWNSNESVSGHIGTFFNFNDQDSVLISGLSTNIAGLTGSFKVGISTGSIGLAKSITQNLVSTGRIEDIYVSRIPNSVSVGSSLLINNEYLRVLNIFPLGSILRVKRFGVGAAHSFGSTINILSNTIDVPLKTPVFDSQKNEKIYFNGHQSVGVGTTTGAGISTTYVVGETSKAITIPTRSIYLPNHSFKTGQQVTVSRSSIAGVDAFIVGNDNTGSGTFYVPDLLTNTSTAYIINKSKDYIGLTTQVGLTTNSEGLYFYSNGSNNSEYLIESNFNQVTGKVDRIVSVITTDERHSLQNNDSIKLTVKPNVVVGLGTTSPLTLTFNETDQKILVNPVGFSSAGINTATNTITINSHGYENGNKVYYSSSEIASGLSTGPYFIVKIDSNSFKFAETYYDTQLSSPNEVNIIGVGGSQHSISLINPQINVTKNSKLTFNLSSSSLSGYNLKIFYDKEFKNEFNSTADVNNFNVTGVGTVGLGTLGSSSLSINYSDSLPPKLFYTLEKSGYISTADTDVVNYSEINFIDSGYNGSHNVFGISTTTFRISPTYVPEVLVYTKNQCETLEYSTSSPAITGAINKVRILSKGLNYKKNPKFVNVISTDGLNANLVAISTSVGRIKDVRIIDMGYEYSSDKTLRPEAFVSPVVKIDDCDTIEYVGIISGGKNYITAPNLILYNPVSKQVVDDSSFVAEVPVSTISKVNILGPTYGLKSVEHRLVSVNNSNGVGIRSAFGSSSGVVTCILSTPPLVGLPTDLFQVGDSIFVEGIELSDLSSGSGYNSSDYEYRFFPVTLWENTNPAKLEFSLVNSEGVGLTTNPGIAKTFQSGYASIINSKNYPFFEIIQKRPLFKLGEQLYVYDGTSYIEEDLYVSKSREDYIKIVGKYELTANQKIRGKTSGIVATVTNILSNKSKFKVDYSTDQQTGWIDDTGKLSEDYQVIQDNDYYQNLSYSIKSSITYDEFVSPVNSTLHPSGLKNFADVGITSSADSSVSYGATTSEVVVLDLVEDKRVDAINNFDLVLDYDTRQNKSKYLKLKNRKLTDYLKCLTNRVLIHDDVSDRFSNKGQQDTYTEIEEITDNYSKYLIQVIDPDSSNSELSELVVLSTTSDTLTLDKNNIYSNVKLGDFSADIDGFGRKTLLFNPVEKYDRDHDIKVLKNIFNTDLVGVGTVTFGSVKLSSSNIGVSSIGSVSIGSSIGTIISYNSSDFNSLVANIQIQNTITKKLNYADVVVDFDGNNAYYAESYFDGTASAFSAEKIGIITAEYDNVTGRISLKIQNDEDDSILVRSNIIGLANTSSGIGTYRFAVPGQPPGAERSARLQSNFTVGVSTLTAFSISLDNDTSVKSIVRVSYGQTSALHEVFLTQNKQNIFINQGAYISVGSTSGIGTFGGETNGSTIDVKFYPDSGISTSVKLQSYSEILYTFSDFDNSPPDLDYGTTTQSVFLSAYDGINGNRANKVDFDLKHIGTPIYVKTFNPSDSTQLNPSTGLFTIPNHFFNTAEELIYTPTSTFVGVGETSVGIGSTANYLGVVTDKLPGIVYPIVINQDQFRLSTRQEYANAGIYVTFTDYGLGNAHKLEMTKKLEKTVISLDGIVQQPITYTPITHTLSFNGGQISAGIQTFSLSGISTILTRDVLKIDNEYMSVVAVGFGSTSTGPITGIGTYNIVSVKRGSVGSISTTHLDGSTARVYRGSFNIVNSKVYFSEPPRGNTRQRRNETNLPYVRSTFGGRTFLRKDYSTNMLFDDISDQFTGIGKTYTLTVQGANTTGLTVGNGILFINGVFQTPSTLNNSGNNYELVSSAGISSVVFTGITSVDGSYVKSDFDINQNQLPRGGIIVSLGSTPGLGYAPLIGAKVKANVNGIGSITSITGISYTGALKPITTASYNNTTGIIEITTTSNHNFVGGDRIKLVGLAFTCPSGSGIVSYFPSRGLDFSYDITGILSSRSFTANVGTSTLPHTYIGLGTVFPWYDLNYGSGYRGPVSIAVTDPQHVGSGATISAVVGAGGTLSFVVSYGGTGYVDPYIQIPDPVYENLPITGVSRLGIGETTESGRNLLLNINVSASSTTGIGSTYFQVSSFKVSRPGYAFRIGDKFKPVGLVTAAGLAAPLAEFELEVLDIFNDYFSAWQFGELDYIDSISLLQNGSRIRFPLYYNGELLSFEIDSSDALSSSVDLNAVLVIFVNGVLQIPGYAYNFEGGTSFEFTEAPSSTDKVDIFFYRGTNGVDVLQVEVDETIKKGDEVYVTKNPNFVQTLDQERSRTVFEIVESDILETDLYSGLGITETTYKPIEWTKQKVDKVIKGDPTYKVRDSIETLVFPSAKIIGDITSSSTQIFVDDAQFFNHEENKYAVTISNFDGLIVSGTDPVSAAFTATVSAAGTVSSITITNAGLGYSGNIPVKISRPKTIGVGVGTTATALAIISSGIVSSVQITDGGFGYEQTNPPQVIVEIPQPETELITNITNVQGFSGIITGITTSAGTGGHPLALKIFFAATKSNGITLEPDANDLQVGYPIAVFDTKVGNGVTSVNSGDTSIVGIGTTFLDNVYIVHSKSNVGPNAEILCNINSNTTTVIGINTSGSLLNPLGRISWGRLYNLQRSTTPISIGVTGLTVNSGLSSFPSIQRRGFGFRDNGSIRDKSLTNTVT